ncbi:MAG: hypothetical protein HY286_00755 [Planctomycetes bacterium]|nr:hypothetical protein [Planctomycetota bacterium]
MKLLTTFVFIVFAAPSFGQDVPEKSTDSIWRNDILLKALTSVKPHTLTDLRARPDAYRSLPVQMDIQFHDTRKGGNPFFTRFSDENYLCFSAWGAEQPLWDQNEYQKDFSFLFVDRNAPEFRTLLEAKVYQRLRVSGVARDVFRGIPYIEIIKAEALDDGMSAAAITHAAKARKLSMQGDTPGAVAEFERALRGAMPAISEAQMRIDLAQVYLQRRERDNAITQLDQAKKLQPKDASLAKSIDKIKDTPLDQLKIEGLREVPAELKDPRQESAASRPAAGVKEASGSIKEAPKTPVADPAAEKKITNPDK